MAFEVEVAGETPKVDMEEVVRIKIKKKVAMIILITGSEVPMVGEEERERPIERE